MSTATEEQMALIQWADSERHNRPEIRMLAAIKTVSDRLPQSGPESAHGDCLCGVSRMFLAVPRRNYSGLFIGLKRPAGGRTTADQKRWSADAKTYGYAARVCCGWEEAKEVIINYLEGKHA